MEEFSFDVLATCSHKRCGRLHSPRNGKLDLATRQPLSALPWPQPSGARREAIADVSRRLLARRSELCLEQQIGLTKLYNQVDDGAWTDLKALHRELDETVAEAYGWPRSIAQDADETNRRLLELNRAIAAGEVAYDPFAYLRKG